MPSTKKKKKKKKEMANLRQAESGIQNPRSQISDQHATTDLSLSLNGYMRFFVLKIVHDI